ncbi:MAG: DUF2334 domain-containing protein [Sarcina sp.]
MKKEKLKGGILRKVKKIFLSIIAATAIIYISTVTYYRFSMIKDIRVENGEVIYKDSLVKRTKHIAKEVEIKHKSETFKIDDISLILNGEKLKEDMDIFELNQRYYVDLEYFLENFDEKYEVKGNTYNIGDIKLDIVNKEFSKGNLEPIKLRGEILNLDGIKYISLNDLEIMFNLGNSWDYEKRIINIFEKEIEEANIDREKLSGKAALLRLEDVSAGNRYATNHGILSMKASADYLYKNGVKFNVAWIPRYIDPGKNLDNNLLTDRSMANAQFVNMLDYLVSKDGVIGLHGYTHQAEQYTTAIGSDLSSIYNSSEEETRMIIESSIETAKVLNIPIAFFESAHYHATKKQQSIIEEYVDTCFEPYKIYWNFQPVISKRNKSTLYVPAPLSYAKDFNGSDLASKIEKNKKRKNILTAFFVHPTKEMDFFEVSDVDANGAVSIVHKEDSPLQNIVEGLKKSGHVTITVQDLQ